MTTNNTTVPATTDTTAQTAPRLEWEHRDYAWFFSEQAKDRLDRLHHISRLFENLFDAKSEHGGDSVVPSGQVSAIFESISDDIAFIQNELYEPGGIFSASEVQAALKYFRNRK